MKRNFILHVPTGLWYNYAYWPDEAKECHMVLTSVKRDALDYTHAFKELSECYEQYNTKFIVHICGEVFNISLNEFELMEIEVKE